jgi:hypothetical protein
MKQKKGIDKGTIIIIGIIALLITGLIYTAISRKEILNSDFTITIANITDVVKNTSKGTTGKKNIAKYSYTHNNKLYKKTVEIYNKNILSGSCYEVKVSNKNPEINEINFDKKTQCNE